MELSNVFNASAALDYASSAASAVHQTVWGVVERHPYLCAAAALTTFAAAYAAKTAWRWETEAPQARVELPAAPPAEPAALALPLVDDLTETGSETASISISSDSIDLHFDVITSGEIAAVKKAIPFDEIHFSQLVYALETHGADHPVTRYLFYSIWDQHSFFLVNYRDYSVLPDLLIQKGNVADELALAFAYVTEKTEGIDMRADAIRQKCREKVEKGIASESLKCTLSILDGDQEAVLAQVERGHRLGREETDLLIATGNLTLLNELQGKIYLDYDNLDIAVELGNPEVIEKVRLMVRYQEFVRNAILPLFTGPVQAVGNLARHAFRFALQ